MLPRRSPLSNRWHEPAPTSRFLNHFPASALLSVGRIEHLNQSAAPITPYVARLCLATMMGWMFGTVHQYP